MFWLKFRMWLLVTVLFSILYGIIVMVGQYLHMGTPVFYLVLAFGMMFFQYMIGPKIVEWSMKVRYVKKEEQPELFRMVEDLARRANIPVPKIGIAEINIPNAFAFGRSIKDGRVCVTSGIMNLLDEEELKAVLGHELSHLKNRDVLTITLLSVIPIVLYHLSWQLMYSRNRNDRSSSGNAMLIGLAAMLLYFITNLLVLYASRIREYFADKGSIDLGNKPSQLASSLYKLVYGSARMNKDSIKEVEGFKAFFVNDPSVALNELRELSQLDLDKNGTIDNAELIALKNKKVVLGFGDKVMELSSTHPNMLKRIKKLSEYQQLGRAAA